MAAAQRNQEQQAQVEQSRLHSRSTGAPLHHHPQLSSPGGHTRRPAPKNHHQLLPKPHTSPTSNAGRPHRAAKATHMIAISTSGAPTAARRPQSRARLVPPAWCPGRKLARRAGRLLLVGRQVAAQKSLQLHLQRACPTRQGKLLPAGSLCAASARTTRPAAQTVHRNCLETESAANEAATVRRAAASSSLGGDGAAIRQPAAVWCNPEAAERPRDCPRSSEQQDTPPDVLQK